MYIYLLSTAFTGFHMQGHGVCLGKKAVLVVPLYDISPNNPTHSPLFPESSRLDSLSILTTAGAVHM